MLKTVAISDLRPNPFRRLDEYPILREKVDPLKESIRSTGFWGTIVGRPAENGQIEIAFGHHRRIALQEVYDGDHEVEIIVRDLSNDEMLKMMARENMEEWGTSAWVELETIRATIQAYGEGKLKQFPKVPKNAPEVRELDLGLDPVRYTKASVAEYLGWTKKHRDGVMPNFACETAFRAIDMIDAGFLSESDLKQLSRKQMAELVQAQWSLFQSETRVADHNKKEAEAASKRAAKAESPQERQRFEKQASIHTEQAQQHESAAKEKVKDFGKEAAAMYQKGAGYRQVRERAEELKPTAPLKTKIHNVDEFASRIARKLENIANGDDDLSADISLLKTCTGDLSSRGLDGLNQSFESLIRRLHELQTSINGKFKKSSRSHGNGTGVLNAQKAIDHAGQEDPEDVDGRQDR